MQNLKRVIECREGKRCNSPIACDKCGENWRRAKFKAFANCLPSVIEDSEIISYLVIKPSELLNLNDGISLMFDFMSELRELKKRGRLPKMYSRLEVSFGKKSLGFNPHLNVLLFDSSSIIQEVAYKYDLKVWSQKKKHDKDTALSIAWYILKHNKIGIEKGEAVRIALNKRTTLLHTKEFNHKSINYIDEFIDLDFSFMGTYPIRSKEEIKLRHEIREKRRKINSMFKLELQRIGGGLRGEP